MKKYLPFIILPVLIVLLILLVIDNNPKINPKVITINTDHNYLYSNKTTIDISLFINDPDSPLINTDAISSSIIKDYAGNKLLHLDLLNITYSHQEIYLSENYTHYILKYEIPNLNNDFFIEDAYLEIGLTNNHKYQLKIGTFNLIFLNNAKELKWVSIDSKKNETSDLSINKLLIETETLIENITSIHINDEDLLYSYINNNLIVTLSDTNYYRYNLPLIVKTLNETYYLNNHKYVTDYNLIELANNNLNIYELNSNN